MILSDNLKCQKMDQNSLFDSVSHSAMWSQVLNL